MKRNPRVFFAFRSPFSWMAIERLLEQVPDAHNTLEFIPYWEPDIETNLELQRRGVTFHYVPMCKAKHLYILQDTKRLSVSMGLKIAWPVDINPRWDLPHFAWLKARRMGMGQQFYSAVTNARWQRGENICDPATIRRLAQSVGLDGETLMGSLDDAAVRSEALDCLAQAFQDDIFGVPYFRVGHHRFWGLDRVQGFVDVLLSGAAIREKQTLGDTSSAGYKKVLVTHEEQAGVEPNSLCLEPLNAGSPFCAYDTDAAGGCG